jgi:hypothetical protein
VIVFLEVIFLKLIISSFIENITTLAYREISHHHGYGYGLRLRTSLSGIERRLR